MIDRPADTIAAIASAPGLAARGIIRLSGPDAFTVLERIFTSDDSGRTPTYPRHVSGKVAIAPDRRIPASSYLFRGPHSSTRQDLVELYVPGAPVLLDMVLEQLLSHGARLAEPGEFTARAFLLGALGLSAAEAVADLIAARGDEQLRAARRVHEGALHRTLARIADALTDLLSLVEAQIDFSDEPIELLPAESLRTGIEAARRDLEELRSRAAPSEQAAGLPNILLFGRPNAGKSTLMNRLSGVPRAVCSALAGTTRDLLSAVISPGGREAVLWDSAGVDPADGGLLAAARARTLRMAEEVDLLCIVVDAVRPVDEALIAEARATGVPRQILALNQCDRLNDAEVTERIAAWRPAAGPPLVAISALTGLGLDRLAEAMTIELRGMGATMGEDRLALNRRQMEAIARAASAMDRAIALLACAMDQPMHGAPASNREAGGAELLAFELREALAALGAVTGEVTTEDLLDRIFARFCLGK